MQAHLYHAEFKRILLSERKQTPDEYELYQGASHRVQKRDSICISSYLPYLSYIMVQYSFPTSGSHPYGYTLKNESIEKNMNKF
ncbi:hypothetical protein IAS59_002695 [Cryptococcus gattii]